MAGRWLRRAIVAVGGIAVAVATGAALVATPASTLIAAGRRPHGPVVTIGDSIMSGHGLRADQAWPVVLGHDDGVDVDNLGCSGAGFTRPGGQCGTDYAGLIPSAVRRDPAVVIIQSSDNDDGATSGQIDRDTWVTVQALHRAIPGALIIGLSTLWDAPETPPAQIADASAALRHAVTAVDGVFVDIGQPTAGRRPLLQRDDEHLTAAGQRVLADVINRDLTGVGIVL